MNCSFSPTAADVNSCGKMKELAKQKQWGWRVISHFYSYRWMSRLHQKNFLWNKKACKYAQMSRWTCYPFKPLKVPEGLVWGHYQNTPRKHLQKKTLRFWGFGETKDPAEPLKGRSDMGAPSRWAATMVRADASQKLDAVSGRTKPSDLLGVRKVLFSTPIAVLFQPLQQPSLCWFPTDVALMNNNVISVP